MGFLDSLNGIKDAVQDRLGNQPQHDPFTRETYFGNNNAYDDEYDDTLSPLHTSLALANSYRQ